MEKSEKQRIFEANNNNTIGERIGASNHVIDAAIKAYREDPGDMAREYVYEAIRVRLHHGAQFLVPKTRDGHYGMLRNQQTKTGVFIAFTSYDGWELSCAEVFESADMKHFLEMVLLSEADGISVNPQLRNASGAADDGTASADAQICGFETERMVSSDAQMCGFETERMVSSDAQMCGFEIDRKGIFRILRSYYNTRYRMEPVKGDITKIKADVIVNATDNALSGGGGVDQAIQEAAGDEMREACRKIGECSTGGIEVTDGFLLSAKYVFHTVGPVYSGTARDASLLASCYRYALMMAKELRAHSIAFPAISTGVFGYPKRDAARVAYRAVREWLEKNESYPLHVLFVCHDDETLGYYLECSGEREGSKMTF